MEGGPAGDAHRTKGTTGSGDRPAESRESTTVPSSALGLLGWAWRRLVSSPELAAPFVLVAVAVTAAEAGITTVPTDLGAAPRFAPWVWPVYLGSFLGGWVGMGAVFLAAADAREGIERSHGRRLLVATERLPPSVGVALLGGIPVVAGLTAFLLPGIYFLLKFALAVPASVVDDLGPTGALRRSFVLTGESLRPIAGLVGSFAVALLLSSLVITLLVEVTGGNGFIGPLIQNLVTAALLPLYGLAFGGLYPADRDSTAGGVSSA